MVHVFQRCERSEDMHKDTNIPLVSFQEPDIDYKGPKLLLSLLIILTILEERVFSLKKKKVFSLFYLFIKNLYEKSTAFLVSNKQKLKIYKVQAGKESGC